MPERDATAVSLTRQAAEAAKAGDLAVARALVVRALHLDHEYEPAWVWLASVVDDDGERRYCLERAAAITPADTTRRALRPLRRTAPQLPADVAGLADPDPPQWTESRPPFSFGRRVSWLRRRWMPVSAVGLVLAAAGVALAMWPAPAPVHLAVAVSGGPDDIVKAVQFGVEETNRAGGVNGHPIEVTVFDDGGTVESASQTARRIVADGRFLAVIGHRDSNASIAAMPIYREARLPAITPTATADEIARDSPWYFRTVYNNSVQGELAALWVRSVLNATDIAFLHGDHPYGRSFRDGFRPGYARAAQPSRIRHDLEIENAPARLDASVAAAVAALKADPPTGPIVLACSETVSRRLIQAVRAAGITVPIVGGEAMSDEAFYASLRALPEDRQHPGLLTKDVFAAAPLIEDSVSGSALRWLQQFTTRFGYQPSWRAVTSYDAFTALANAFTRGGLEFGEPSRPQDRDRIRGWLAGLKDREHSIKGLVGPLYFDPSGSRIQLATFGTSDGRRLVSLPAQLASASEGEGVAPGASPTGGYLDFHGEALVRQRVVVTGLNLNEINHLDLRARNYDADFYVWFKYSGDDAPTDIVFANATDEKLTLGTPVRASETNGIKYRLYRVRANFQASLDFQNFPFDTQHLKITFQNRHLPATRILYVTDSLIFNQPPAQALLSGSNVGESIDQLPNWNATEVLMNPDTVGSSAEQADPALGGQTPQIYYAQYVTDVALVRNATPFLVKNLLPLVLLAAVVYLSLYLPFELASARISIGVTGILSTAVLLGAVTSGLPEVSYTVAIEWSYYAFVFLAVTCVLLALIGGKWQKENRHTALRRLTWYSRTYYPTYILAVALAYCWTFA